MDGEFDLAEGRIGVEGVALGVIFAGGSAARSTTPSSTNS